MRHRFFFSNSGYSLIEILVAIGLMSVLSLAVGAAVLNVTKDLKRSTLIQTRNQLVNQLRITAADPKAIDVTIHRPENRPLYNCVCGVDTCTNIQQPFVSLTLSDTSGQIQSPIYYDESGIPCDASQPKCLIRVETTFFAQCLPEFTSPNQNPPPNCNGTQAEFFAIMYKVDQNPNTLAESGPLIKPVSGPVYTQVQDISPGACP